MDFHISRIGKTIEMKSMRFGVCIDFPASTSTRAGSASCLAEGGHSCPPCQWREKGEELRAVLSHRIGTTTGVSWLLIAKVAADGGEIVAFEIEEAPGDVEAVRWIQKQAEAGMGKKCRVSSEQ